MKKNPDKKLIIPSKPREDTGFPRSSAKRSTPGKTSEKTAVLSKKTFPIVGVGASAGGMEAFTQLLKHLPVDTGMGFVLVQHLDPVHESALTEILTRATTMPVHEVTNDLRVEPNHVYVIPPNKGMEIDEGVLKLQPRSAQARGAQHSIDVFFESLANDRGKRAIGVILSGTASDGTLGLEAIKAEGGITFSQDESAKFDSMPRSAVAAGCVDFVLSPDAIAEEVARIARHPFVATGDTAISLPEADREADQREGPDDSLASGGKGNPRTASKQARSEAKSATDHPLTAEDIEFRKILVLLRTHCGVDFSLYKSNTIQRRISRRMVLSRHDALGGYVTFLRGNTKELDALYSDVLISVTSFFRNAEAFDALKHKVFPALLAQRGRTGPVRVWTLGCSTGQEAYSIAMAFAEFSEKVPRAPKLQVFATDLNEALLEKARHGLYAKTLAQDLSPERLGRFFVEEEGGYRINKLLREQVVFARQNVMNDPPFSRIDLISCRNLLIYFEAGLQKKIMPAFHYALKPGGFLFLGASESVGPFTDLFEPVDKKQKIFSRKAAPTPTFRLPLPHERSVHTLQGRRVLSLVERAQGMPDGLRAEVDAQREADRLSVSQFAPPGVLINAEFQVLQFRGATRDYLEPPTGKASFDVLKMACEGLMLPLRAAINLAKRERTTVRRENVRFRQKGETRLVHLRVVPLKNLKETCYLIFFEDAKTSDGGRNAPAGQIERDIAKKIRPVATNATARRVAELERELSATRDFLQSIQEQFEASSEELQASSEEVQSANEELQSINEELETSKEELESTNEELTTVNEEMTNRNGELNGLNNDLNNLHVSLATAILVLGRDLTIRRFTVQAEKIFNLLPGDVGRPISGIRHNLDCRDLETFVREVIDTVSPGQREVRDKEGRWYSLRARPYLTLDNKIDGAVLVLVDIDALKRSEDEILKARDYADAILQEVPPLLILEKNLRVVTANDSFYKQFKVSRAQTENRLVYELGDGQWQIPRLRILLEEILPCHSFFNDFEITHDFLGLGLRTMLLHGRQLDSVQRIVLRVEDVTERVESRAAMKRSEIRYRRLFEAAKDGILILDPGSRTIADANPFMIEFLGYSRAELLGKELWQIGLLRDEQANKEAMRDLQDRGIIRYENLPLKTKAGEKREVEFVSNLYEEDGQHVIQCNIRDITERKGTERALQQSEKQFRAFVAASSEVIYRMNADWSEMFHLEGQNFIADTLKPSRSWLQEYIHRDDQQQVLDAIKEAVRTKSTFELEHRVRRVDGSFGWTLSRAIPLLDANGEILEWFGAASDVTERVNAKLASLQSIDDLNAARGAAERGSRAKDDFLAALSHELRTPLTPVLLAVSALHEDARLPADARQQLGMVERNIALEARLIDDLLDLTTISHGKLQLRVQLCDTHSLIGRAIEIVREEANAKEIVIERLLTARNSGLVADPARFQQVIWNLLRNAVKFTPRGGSIAIRTSEEKVAEGGRWLRIEVVDSGIGIAAALLDQIFMPFDQGGLVGDHRFGGVGLGLAIARAIVQLHGGRISAQSSGPERGSTFVVELPGAVEPQSGLTETTSPFLPGHVDSGPTPLKVPIHPLRLLVVEDHPSTLQALSMLLQRDGHHVVTAPTMAQALAAATTNPFDLVISDLGLPDGTGVDLMEKLRATYGLRGIALSGYGMAEDLGRSRDAGFVTHLIKPVAITELRRVIASLSPVEN